MCLALGLAFFSQNLKIDNSLEVWFLKNDPVLLLYDEFKKLYGNMDERHPEIIAFVNESFKGLDYKLAGNGIVYQELNRLSLWDSSLFTGFTFVILIVAIVVLFQKTSVLLSLMITMILSSLMFLGLYSLFGQKINIISAILPSLIVILCLEDVIFIFSNYYSMPPAGRTLAGNIAYSAVPCFLPSFTTAMGFFHSVRVRWQCRRNSAFLLLLEL